MAGEVVASEEETHQVTLLPGGGAEQNPQHWWDLITMASSRLMERGAVPAESVAAVACTAQWSGTVAVDEHGQPIRDAIIWMDSRGAPYARRVTGGAVKVQGYGVIKLARWLRVTAGIPARSGKDPIAHILWLKHEEPETYHRAHKFLEPKDWLNARLTGRLAASFDSIALHWVTDNRHPDRIRYDPGLLRLAGIEESRLPELLAATDILGPLSPEPAAALGVPAGIPVVVGTPDLQSAAIGSGATRDYQAHLYIGTSSWLTCHVPFKKTDLLHNMASLPSPVPGRYFIADEQETAGAALTFLRDRVLFGDDPPASAYREFDRMAGQAPPGSGGLIFTPWLYGERTPVEDRFVRGGFHNLSLSASREDLVRAVFEGVAFNTRWLLQDGGALHPPPARADPVHRRRRPFGCVVPDLRRRARPHHRAGGRPGERGHTRSGLAGRGRARRAHLRPDTGPGSGGGKLPARPRTTETLRRSLPGIRGALPPQPQGIRPPQPRTCHMTDATCGRAGAAGSAWRLSWPSRSRPAA